ncbi:hypothetical protein BgiBS90_019751 [Biomphalaria glabrata]|nr:hypothetical protein BgiBS90_019751 [Biomphalaria glabrata]
MNESSLNIYSLVPNVSETPSQQKSTEPESTEFDMNESSLNIYSLVPVESETPSQQKAAEPESTEFDMNESSLNIYSLVPVESETPSQRKSTEYESPCNMFYENEAANISEVPISNPVKLNVGKIASLKEYAYFIFNEMTKTELSMFFSRISSPQKEKFNESVYEKKFKKFEALTLSIDRAFQEPESAPPKAILTHDNIFKLPSFSGKGRGRLRNRTTPTLPNIISGEEFRASLKRKMIEKDEIEKSKIDRKHKGEENKRIREELDEKTRLFQEHKKIEKAKKKEEEAKKKEEEAKKRGKKKSVNFTKKNSDVVENPDSRKSKEMELSKSIEVDNVELFTNEKCLGCNTMDQGDL